MAEEQVQKVTNYFVFLVQALNRRLPKSWFYDCSSVESTIAQTSNQLLYMSRVDVYQEDRSTLHVVRRRKFAIWLPKRLEIV